MCRTRLWILLEINNSLRAVLIYASIGLFSFIADRYDVYSALTYMWVFWGPQSCPAIRAAQTHAFLTYIWLTWRIMGCRDVHWLAWCSLALSCTSGGSGIRLVVVAYVGLSRRTLDCSGVYQAALMYIVAQDRCSLPEQKAWMGDDEINVVLFHTSILQ
jgi:hypothetical protein